MKNHADGTEADTQPQMLSEYVKQVERHKESEQEIYTARREKLRKKAKQELQQGVSSQKDDQFEKMKNMFKKNEN